MVIAYFRQRQPQNLQTENCMHIRWLRIKCDHYCGGDVPNKCAARVPLPFRLSRNFVPYFSNLNTNIFIIRAICIIHSRENPIHIALTANSSNATGHLFPI